MKDELKVAFIMSGLPRFGEDTDEFLYKLKEAPFIDYYISFWDHRVVGGSDYDFRWQQFSVDEITEEIQSRLPENHAVKFFEWVNVNNVPRMPREYPAFYNVPINCWQQYSILDKVNSARLKQEKEQGWQYDLIVRGRPDAGVNTSIDLTNLEHRLNVLELFIPDNQRHGPYQFCDHWAIGKPPAMNALAQSVRQFDQYYLNGVPFNAEHLVGRILRDQGVFWGKSHKQSTLKTSGKYDDKGVFHQNPGRWDLSNSKYLK
jgi:hypothetical protein